MKHRKKTVALALVCALTAYQAQAADSVMDQAYKHMQANNAKAAYALLEPEESARAGDKDFDFLFALSALEVGQNTRAIFALERVLAADPNNARARAELGRAYLAVGETSAAKNELNTVRDMGIPTEVAKSIDNILDAVDRVEGESKTVIRGYVEGSLGYDTNVNASTTQGTVAVPAVGGGSIAFDLTANSRAREDWFGIVGGGISFRSPLNTEWAVLGSASGNQRLNLHHEDLDQLNTDFNLGVVNNQGKHVFSLTGQMNTLRLDGDRFRDVYGATGQWQYNMDARNQLSAYVQYGDLSYTTQSIRDADRWTVGAGYAHALRDGTLLFGSLYSVREDNQQSFGSLSLDGWGMRFGGQMDLTNNTVLFANANYEHRKHDGEDPTFFVIRKDTQVNVNLGLTHLIKRNLRVTGQYQYTDQDSNLVFNDYDRNMISVTLRQDF